MPNLDPENPVIKSAPCLSLGPEGDFLYLGGLPQFVLASAEDQERADAAGPWPILERIVLSGGIPRGIPDVYL